MKPLLFLLVMFTSLFIITSYLYALETGKAIVPYGDFCTNMNRYGAHAEMMDHRSAAHALHHYFNKKGVDVHILDKGGRFIKVQILEKGRVIDIILFDRRTGRMRSIY